MHLKLVDLPLEKELLEPNLGMACVNYVDREVVSMAGDSVEVGGWGREDI